MKAWIRVALLRLCASTFCVLGATASAQDYPNKPVNIVVGFGPGSGTDIVARIIAEELKTAFKQPFVVLNRPGATAAIAAEQVAAAAPDGYTLFITSNSSHSVNPHLYKSLRYDPKKDFTPIGRIADFPFTLVVDSNLPVTTPQELVAYVRARPGKVSYAYGNTPGQVAGAALNKLLDLNMTGVPYKSSPQAMADVVAGHAAFMVVDLASSQALVKAGRLRALAVTTSTRSALAPELPTIVETLGLEGFDLRAWTGMFGPAGLPGDVTERLSAELFRIVSRSDIRTRLLSGNMEPTPSREAAFGTFLNAQYEVWGRKIREAGIQPE
jgi:tripartite-type tricarboxylate transporter receptor subunit TctC